MSWAKGNEVLLASGLALRGTGLGVVWPQFLALLAIGGVFFVIALSRLRKSLN